MTVLDSRVISILAKRAPNVTVIQAQNICTDMAEAGVLEGFKFTDVPPVDNSFVRGYESLEINYDDDPSPEEVEELSNEARKISIPLTANEEIRQLRAEVRRLKKYEEYVQESGYELGFRQWAVQPKNKDNPFKP